MIQKWLEAVTWMCSVKKMFLRISQNSQEKTCARASFSIILATLLKKETLAQFFSNEFCEIFKNTFSYITRPMLWLVPNGQKDGMIIET